MSNAEVFSNFILPLVIAAATAAAGFIGTQLKSLYQQYVNDKTKEAVVRTCVKAAEQLYHDLSGAEKLKKAQEGVVQMLQEKGIPISELEMNLLIESVVSEFNYGFAKDIKVPSNEKKSDGEDPLTALRSVQDDSAEYSEEGGGV